MYSCETVWVKLKVLVSIGAVKNYSANTIMEKKQAEGEIGG